MTPTQPPDDALEQRDTWRSIWLVLTHDALVVALVIALVLVGGAAIVLPQAPAAGTADPVAYSQWQAQAQSQTGAAYAAWTALGLFDVAGALWLRVLIWVLVALALLRLVDRVARLVSARRPDGSIQDEQRLRVTERAADLDDMAARLREQHYRVATSSGEPAWVWADRAPWGELLSVLLHAGLLIALAGVLLNLDQGWEVPRLQVNSDAPVSLKEGAWSVELLSADRALNQAVLGVAGTTSAGETSPVTLTVGSNARLGTVAGPAMPCCLELTLAELTTEYQIRAVSAGGSPLTLTLSSYVSPTTEVLLTFRPGESERSLAAEQAGMALLVSARSAGDRVQAFAIPSGRVLTDTLIRPSLVISGTTVQFAPRAGAIAGVAYRPGEPLVWFGAIVGLIGLAGALLYPMQRIIVRQHGLWTEFYAGGRRVRPVVRELSAPDIQDRVVESQG